MESNEWLWTSKFCTLFSYLTTLNTAATSNGPQPLSPTLQKAIMCNRGYSRPISPQTPEGGDSNQK